MRNSFERDLREIEVKAKHQRQMEIDDITHRIQKGLWLTCYYGWIPSLMVVIGVYAANNTLQSAYKDMLNIGPDLLKMVAAIMLDRFLFRK